MNLSVLDESQCLLCLIIADSNSWQQNLRREREKVPKATELYLIEEKKHFLQMTVLAYGWSELNVFLYIL